jgi:hypothetical protein
MRGKIGLAVLAAGWLGGAAAARAQATRAQLTVAATAGATDNATAAPSATGAGDVFYGIEPTLALILETPRWASTLSLLGSVQQYRTYTEADTRSLRGRWELSA